jgi:probable F420-dependent oxidoreductase
MRCGVFVFVTDNGIGPGEAAQAAERAGLATIWTGDHSHIPTDNATIDGLDQLPEFIDCYARFYDQMVALTAMAAATNTIRIGSGICLVPMREPLFLAKQVASIDHLSGGRVQLAVGAGWNHQELLNHGVDPASRFRRMREHIQAMKVIWTNDVADFDGEFVRFQGVMSWPKPIQDPHPPIIVGGRGPRVLDRVFDYGDGWAPDIENLEQLEALVPRVEEFKRRREESGRDVLLAICGIALDETCVRRAEELGVDLLVFMAPAGSREQILGSIERAGELALSVSY